MNNFSVEFEILSYSTSISYLTHGETYVNLYVYDAFYSQYRILPLQF